MSEQPPPDMSAEDIVYKEYVRLSDAATQLTNSSFEDFKLLAVVGAILGFKPLVDSFDPKTPLEAPTLFLVFITLLSLIAIIAFRDILKRSLIDYTVGHLSKYEGVIRQRVEDAETAGLFKLYGGIEGWVRKEQFLPLIAFKVVFLLPVLAVPTTILWGAEKDGVHYYSLGYAAACLLVFVTLLLIGGKLPRKNEPVSPHARP